MTSTFKVGSKIKVTSSLQEKNASNFVTIRCMRRSPPDTIMCKRTFNHSNVSWDLGPSSKPVQGHCTSSYQGQQLCQVVQCIRNLQHWHTKFCTQTLNSDLWINLKSTSRVYSPDMAMSTRTFYSDLLWHRPCRY